MDIYELAQQITMEGPAEAARLLARLFKTILDVLPGITSRGKFITQFQVEMGKIGYQVMLGPNLERFHNLAVGEYFKNRYGRLYRKIEPVALYDPREELTLHLAGLDLELGRPAYFSAGELVERFDPQQGD